MRHPILRVRGNLQSVSCKQKLGADHSEADIYPLRGIMQSGLKAKVGQACPEDLIYRRDGPARLHKLQPVI